VIDRLEIGSSTCVRSENWPEAVVALQTHARAMGLDPREAGRSISSALAEIAQRAVDRTTTRRLVVLGGDTSARVCSALAIEETVVLDELAPGLPSSLVIGERPLLVVLKSGSFGGADFALRAIHHLSAA
jgi:uncharacterized protein YgbK (DUF1537 family)